MEDEKKLTPTENNDQKIDINKSLIKLDNSIHFKLDTNKTVADQAQDLVDLAATSKAVEDEKLVDDITAIKKEELKIHAETRAKEKTAESKKSEKKLQEATYGVYEGIADLIGLKKPLPNKMLKSLMWILIPFLILYYFMVGLITGIINITMDCVNAIVIRFAEFTKPARNVIVFVLITFLAGSIIIVILFLLKKYGIINI